MRCSRWQSDHDHQRNVGLGPQRRASVSGTHTHTHTHAHKTHTNTHTHTHRHIHTHTHTHTHTQRERAAHTLTRPSRHTKICCERFASDELLLAICNSERDIRVRMRSHRRASLSYMELKSTSFTYLYKRYLFAFVSLNADGHSLFALQRSHFGLIGVQIVCPNPTRRRLICDQCSLGSQLSNAYISLRTCTCSFLHADTTHTHTHTHTHARAHTHTHTRKERCHPYHSCVLWLLVCGFNPSQPVGDPMNMNIHSDPDRSDGRFSSIF